MELIWGNLGFSSSSENRFLLKASIGVFTGIPVFFTGIPVVFQYFQRRIKLLVLFTSLSISVSRVTTNPEFQS